MDLITQNIQNRNLEKVQAEAVQHSDTLTIESNALVITDREGLEYAATLNRQARDQLKTIEEAFKEHKQRAWDAHKGLCAAESKAMAPFKSVASILKPKILKYQADQEARERKIREEAERKQREIEAEAKRKAQEEKDKHTEKLMESGDLEKAEIVMEAPTITPVAAIVPEVKREAVKGAGTRKVWKARVIDFSRVDDRFKVIDQKAIDGMAKICKDKSTEPGLEFYQETQLTGK